MQIRILIMYSPICDYNKRSLIYPWKFRKSDCHQCAIKQAVASLASVIENDATSFKVKREMVIFIQYKRRIRMTTMKKESNSNVLENVNGLLRIHSIEGLNLPLSHRN